MDSITVNLTVISAVIGSLTLLSQVLGIVIKQSRELGKMESKIEAEFKLQAQQRAYEDEMIIYRIRQLENFASSKAGYKIRHNQPDRCDIE